MKKIAFFYTCFQIDPQKSGSSGSAVLERLILPIISSLLGTALEIASGSWNPKSGSSNNYYCFSSLKEPSLFNSIRARVGKTFTTTSVVVQPSPHTFLTVLNILNQQTKEFVMNQTNKENIDFFNKYSKNFPAVRDVQSRKLSDQERFIKQQEPLIDGAAVCMTPEGLHIGAGFDYSNFSGVCLHIRLMDVDCLLYSKGLWSTEKFCLQQDFFDHLFKNSEEVPKLTFIERSEFYGENGKHKEVINVVCGIYPVLPLGNRNLYKVDVSVEIQGKFPTVSLDKTDHSRESEAIISFIQRHFTVDKEGLTFQESAKEALSECLGYVESIFMKTKDKKIYIVKESE